MMLFYLLAGINHFRSPEVYFPIIPPYLGNKELINYASGMAEIIGALLLLLPATRKFACYGIIAMLLAFIPTHIYMIETGGCVAGYCLPAWGLWARLLVLQPLLIYWAWYNRNG